MGADTFIEGQVGPWTQRWQRDEGERGRLMQRFEGFIHSLHALPAT